MANLGAYFLEWRPIGGKLQPCSKILDKGGIDRQLKNTLAYYTKVVIAAVIFFIVEVLRVENLNDFESKFFSSKIKLDSRTLFTKFFKKILTFIDKTFSLFFFHVNSYQIII